MRGSTAAWGIPREGYCVLRCERETLESWEYSTAGGGEGRDCLLDHVFEKNGGSHGKECISNLIGERGEMVTGRK